MLSNTAATVADFLTASALVYALHVFAPTATALGAIVGACVSFGLSRVWAFEATGAVLPQMLRYSVVSAATAALNAGGVFLLSWAHSPFVAAWLITRCVVFMAWSYPLQRHFVFADRRQPELSKIKTE
jgi:putative flippase GtrA